MSPLETPKRPGFAASAAATAAAMRGNSKFFDMSPNTTAMVRFLPPAFPDGRIFFQTMNHFGMKDPQDPARGVALACLKEHGTEETGKKCWICDVIDFLGKKGTADQKKIIKGKGSLSVGSKYYAQVLIGEKSGDGWKYNRPVLMALNFNGATAVQSVQQRCEFMNIKSFTDPDEGQSLLITRNDSGGSNNKVTYSAERTGLVERLDDIYPTWVEEFMQDIPTAVDLKIMNREQQKAYVKHSFGERIDWEVLEANGL